MLRIIYPTKNLITMKAVLLAAGKGKRLSPITEKLPKQMIKIAGKPILEYVIEYLIQLNFDNVCIIISPQSEQIKKYFGDGTNYGIKITYIYQKEQKGTAHATNLAKDFVGQDGFLLYLADTIIPNIHEDFLQKITSNKFEVEILSSKITEEKSNSVGNILLDGDLVTKITEKSITTGTKLGWGGIAFFKSNLIFKMIEKLNPSVTGEYEITDAMNDILLIEKKIRNHICTSFIDTGTLKGLLNLMRYLFVNKNDSPFKIDLPILSNPIYIGKNCKFGKNTIIGPVVSIGNNVSIGDNTIIKNSIILDDVIIPSNQKISDSILSNEHQLSL